MNQTTEHQRYPDDEIDLRELFITLWRGKYLIVATTIIFAAAGIAYALYKPNIYQASVLLAPVNDERGGLGGISSQLGGLASLAGISLGGSGSNQTVIAKEILQSRAFLTDFIRRHKLSKPLKAIIGWSKDSNDWVYDKDLYDAVEQEWLPDSGGESQEPTDWELVEVFRQDHFSISESKDTGMITVRLKHYSPVAAQQWTEWLILDLNEHMRKKDVKEAEARVSYLEGKLQETNIAGMQQVFYQLIESETRTIMLANAQHEYIFKIVDPPIIPEEKISPNRPLIIVLFTLLGGVLGTLVVLVSSYIGLAQFNKKRE